MAKYLITTPFPTVREVADLLEVSPKRVAQLEKMFEPSTAKAVPKRGSAITGRFTVRKAARRKARA